MFFFSMSSNQSLPSDHSFLLKVGQQGPVISYISIPAMLLTFLLNVLNTWICWFVVLSQCSLTVQ